VRSLSGARVVLADVTDEAAVAELARRAVEQFGRSDVWVNNASVYSHVGAPWLTAYVSSKFAVRGSAAV
jgi:NAD(P)-dependent dehydrogenase (short-subunit alcohol dehydrogenase family)